MRSLAVSLLTFCLVSTVEAQRATSQFPPDGVGVGIGSAPAEGYSQGFGIGINLHFGHFSQNAKARASFGTMSFSPAEDGDGVTLSKLGLGASYGFGGFSEPTGGYFLAEVLGLQGRVGDRKSSWQQGMAAGAGFRFPFWNRPSAIELVLNSASGVSYITTMFVIDVR